MPKVDVINLKNEKVGQVALADEIFAAAVNKPLLHETVEMQRAAMRQGTASTKTRAEVRGGGKKPWRQKGTGRARHGSIRSPIWRGGGVTFGPRPRSYGYDMPRAKYRTALRSALSAKLAAGELVVVEGLSAVEPKTKALSAAFKAMGRDRRVLLVVDEPSVGLTRASQNLSFLELISVTGLNVYDLLANRHVIISREVVERVQEVWK